MKKFAFIVIGCLICFLFPLHSFASDSVPYKTYTEAANGSPVETQTAYKPIGIFAPNSGIEKPEDVFIDTRNLVYVADSGLKEVLVFDSNGKVLKTLGKGTLQEPTGVFVDKTGSVYVADHGKNEIFRFSQDGKLTGTYGKPKSPLFGKGSKFKPEKVAVDRRGNIFVISEGSTDGIIQLSPDGSFFGFFGVNRTEGSITSSVLGLLESDKQKANRFLKAPPAPTNIVIDHSGLVNSITSGTDFEVIKRLNIAGGNLLPPHISDDRGLVDITVDAIGDIFVIDSDGIIFEYDQSGHILFAFGGKDDGSNRLGLFKQPSGLSVDKNDRLYVSDRDRGLIQVFSPTAFTQTVHKGIDLFNQGLYVKSENDWKDTLMMNDSFGLAHEAMGKAYYKIQNYDQSLHEFKLAEDKAGYSDAFWELRHKWLQNNLGWMIWLVVILLIVRAVIKYFDRKRNILEPVRRKWKAFKDKKLVGELLFSLRFLRHPIDSFYYRKYENYLSVGSATILYVLMFLEYLFSQFETGFIFNSGSIEHTSLFMVIVTFFGPIALFIVSNYLVATINDGEGSFKDVYIGVIYSLVPYWLFLIPVTLVSKILTINESFIYTFSMDIMIGWSCVILFIMLQELHGYTIRETIKNILITIFCMIIIVLVIFILYVLFKQVYDFVYTVIQEVILRV